METNLYIKRFKKNWAFLVQIAAIVGAVVGGIIIPPETLTSIIETNRTKALALFSVAVSVSVFLFFSSKQNSKKDAFKWTLTTIIFFLLSIISLIYFLHTKSTRTCLYANQVVGIGNSYTAKGVDYTLKNPEMSCEALLKDFAGKTDDIWTVESINNSRLLLFGIYLLTFILISICILSAVQIIYCLTTEKTH